MDTKELSTSHGKNVVASQQCKKVMERRNERINRVYRRRWTFKGGRKGVYFDLFEIKGVKLTSLYSTITWSFKKLKINPQSIFYSLLNPNDIFINPNFNPFTHVLLGHFYFLMCEWDKIRVNRFVSLIYLLYPPWCESNIKGLWEATKLVTR